MKRKINFIKAASLLLAALLLLLSLASCGGKKSKEFILPERTLPENAEEKSFSTFKYMAYDDGSLIITGYSGSDTVLNIPDKIDSMPVVALADELFAENQSLRSVKLGKSLEVIGNNCFYGCSSLTSVEIPSTVWSIGCSAFYDTPWINTLTDEFVVVGDGVLIRYQGDDTHVTIPDNVRHISDAFESNLKIRAVTMGPSVYTVGKYAFYCCESLRTVEFGENLVLIDEGAFLECVELTSIILPDSLKKIGDSAFMYCLAVVDIKMGEGLQYIGEYAFARSTMVRTVYLPESVTFIGDYAFLELYYLELVVYGGTEEQFNALGINTTNYTFLDAERIYSPKK